MSVFGVITHQYLPFLARAVSKYFLKHLDCTSHKSVELQSNLKHSGNFFYWKHIRPLENQYGQVRCFSDIALLFSGIANGSAELMCGARSREWVHQKTTNQPTNMTNQKSKSGSCKFIRARPVYASRKTSWFLIK